MRVHVIFIISSFLKSFLHVSSIIFSLVFILNILTEIEFFKKIEVETYFPIYMAFLNSPSLLFEMFPFIFLVATQTFFIGLLKNKQIEIFKYSGLKNSKIFLISTCTAFVLSLFLISLFYNLSSNLKSVYLEIKNNFTTDDKYLAVITNNGLWIKDSYEDKVSIINANKIEDTFLIDTSITILNDNFEVINHIESKKVNIKNNNWIIINPTIYKGNQKSESEYLNFYSNFDYRRIQSLFSNLSSLSILELIELRENYQLLNLSIIDVNMQINKIFSFPLYLTLMTILSLIIMFNTKHLKSNTLKISIGLFFSVIIYYLNNFANVLGSTEKISVIPSIWMPLVLILITNMFYLKNINEK